MSWKDINDNVNQQFNYLYLILKEYKIDNFWGFWTKEVLFKPKGVFYRIMDKQDDWIKRYGLDILNHEDKKFIKKLYQDLVVNKKDVKDIDFKNKKIKKYFIDAEDKKYQSLLKTIDRMNQIVTLNLTKFDYYDIDLKTNKIIVLNEQMFLEKLYYFFTNTNFLQKVKELFEKRPYNPNNKSFWEFVGDISETFGFNFIKGIKDA